MYMYVYIYIYIYIYTCIYIFEHFSSDDHNGFLEDCGITFIDKTDRSDPTRREEY